MIQLLRFRTLGIAKLPTSNKGIAVAITKAGRPCFRQKETGLSSHHPICFRCYHQQNDSGGISLDPLDSTKQAATWNGGWHMQNYVCPYGRIIQVHLNYVKWLNKDFFDFYHSETPKTALHVPIWQSHIFSKKSTVGKKCVSRKTTPVLGLILIHNWLKENTSDITKKSNNTHQEKPLS